MDEPFLVSLARGDDLIKAVTAEFRKRVMRKAAFSLIGSLNTAVIAWYDPVARVFKTKRFPGLLEIVSCTGNVSEKDGEIFVHAHIVLGKEDFSCVSGHVMEGSEISVAELFGMPVPGPVPVREYDEATGLALWPRT